jgi:hypothetical protein
MPVNITFLVVEGPHDAEFMARLLPRQKFEQRKKLSEIPEPYRKLIPKDYPAKDKNGKEVPLTDPHPVPRFYQNGKDTERWVFILIGGGSKSAQTLAKALRTSRLAGFNVDAIGVILDQDLETTPEEARDKFIEEFTREQDLPITVDFNFAPGTLVQGTPRLGLFVLPDNGQPGALEDLLLECGEVQYKSLKDKALFFRDDALGNAALTAADLAEYGKLGGQKNISKKKKAWVSVMGAVLMPSVAIQNSIRENRWVEDEALKLPRIQAVQTFIGNLIA